MVYDRLADDGRPLVVLVRTGNAEATALLQHGVATAINCRADAANVNVQGMPQGTARLYPLEDRLDEAPALRSAHAIRVASVTGQGQRRMYFVHRDPVDFASILASSEVEGFLCSSSEVSDRQALIQLVTPTPLEIQLNGDQEVIANLQKNGDDGLLPRKTDFWFYGEKAALSNLATHLKPFGFSIDHWTTSPMGLVLTRDMPVDLASFRKTTPIIVDGTTRYDVTYDGWETLVISEASAPPTGN